MYDCFSRIPNQWNCNPQNYSFGTPYNTPCAWPIKRAKSHMTTLGNRQENYSVFRPLDDINVHFWFCSFVSRLQKCGKFHICHTSQFYRSTARKSRLELQIAVAKPDARKWGRNNQQSCGQSRIPRNNFLNVLKSVAEVNSILVSFTRHRNGSRVWRIHETLVIGAATRKKLSSVMRPTLLKPNSNLNRWPDWNKICNLEFVRLLHSGFR